MQPQLQSQSSLINGYKIVNQIKYQTYNKLYVVHKQTQPQGLLYILKIYKNNQGYKQQKKVFQISELYAGYFVQAGDSGNFNGNLIQYTISKYSACQSLLTFCKSIRQFPMKAVKFYMHSLFSKLKTIHYGYKIPYRTLYPSDVILSQTKELFIVGWSKLNQQITQHELIFDCASIMFFLITKGAFSQRGIGIKNDQIKRFVSEDFWNKNKSQYYTKYFPKQTNEYDQLVRFFKKITVKKLMNNVTLQNVLNDEYFNGIANFQQASIDLTTLQMQSKTKQKQKQLKQFEIQIQRINTKNRQQIQLINKINKQGDQYRSCFDNFQVLKSPFMVKMDNNYLEKQTICYQSKRCQTKQLNQHQIQRVDKKDIQSMIKAFLDMKLENAINCSAVFDQEWITVFRYEIQSINSQVYMIKCQFKIVQTQQCVPELVKVNFILSILLNKQNKQSKECIQSYRLRSEQKMDQILFMKFEQYLCEGLIGSFKYENQ